jgi:lipid-A-disaccharide synthase
MGVPQAVCYKGSWISYQIAKRIVHVPFISLVNLIMEREVVRELIQDDLNPARLEKELLAILDGQKREAMRRDYEDLRKRLGEQGASARTAERMVQYLSSK